MKLQDYILQELTAKRISAAQAAQLLEQTKPVAEQHECVITGYSCMLPDADEPEEYWQNLLDKKDSIKSFPQQRIDDVVYLNEKSYKKYNGFNHRVGGYLDRIDMFDPDFFGISMRDAEIMDPAQRLFLMTAYKAFEHAGMTFNQLRQSRTGIFIGYSVSEENFFGIIDRADSNAILANQPALMAYRLAYLYDLTGPTMLIDTTCSSSLVAFHMACQSVMQGDCDQAIVAGVNIHLFPAIREISNLGIEAYDGRCKTFDARANGTNIGDGIAVVIIKRKDLALKHHDWIHAEIKGSAVNSDGHSNGITSPNPKAQADVILQAWKKAKLNPEHLSFIESHGTGTKLGDSVEVNGLSHAFRQHTSAKKICPLGAAKTNIGHLEATAGLAGLIKVLLCLRNRKLPPNLHFESCNPYIDFNNTAVKPCNELIDWTDTQDKLSAGLSSFGISGTNCHVVLEQAENKNISTNTNNELEIIYISARHPESLHVLIKKYSDLISSDVSFSLHDFSYATLHTRNHFQHRLVCVARNLAELKDQLTGILLKHRENNSLDIGGIKNVFMSDVNTINSLSGCVFPTELTALQMHSLQCYLSGDQPDEAGDIHEANTKIPLPTYPFHLKRCWPNLTVVRQSLEERVNNLFYELRWEHEPYSSAPVNLLALDNACVIAFNEEGKNPAILDYISNKGMRIINVIAGSQYSEIEPDCFTININNESDYHSLFNALSQRQIEIKAILHLLDKVDAKDNFSDMDNLILSQASGAFSAFHIVRAMMKYYGEKYVKWIAMTSHACSINDADAMNLDPTRSPAIGIHKVISQEFPKVQSIIVDMDNAPLDSNVFEHLYQEIFLQDNYKEHLIAYRHGKRYVQVTHSMDTSHLTKSSPLIVENGVYLIMGGTGYLGMETALYLAKQAKVHIIITGRQNAAFLNQPDLQINETLSKRQKRQLEIADQIRLLGSRLTFLMTDATSADTYDIVKNQLQLLDGKLNGVFLAIKNISHQRLDVVSTQDFTNNILAKLKATWVADRLRNDFNADFIALFSSISSLTGGPTGADCCASNIFLDAFEQYRNRSGALTLTMNYTLIDADDGSLLSDRMSMIPPLSKEEFIGCLEKCLNHKIHFAMMVNFNSQVMNMVLPFMKIRFSPQLLKHFKSGKDAGVIEAANDKRHTPSATPVTNVNNAFTLDEINLCMNDIWEEVLGNKNLKAGDNFFDLGGDSISAVKLMHLITTRLKIELDVSTLYSYPTMNALSQFLFNQINPDLITSNEKNDKSDTYLDDVLDSINNKELDLDQAIAMLSGKK